MANSPLHTPFKRVVTRLECLFGHHAWRPPEWVPIDSDGFITQSHFIAKCEHCSFRREVYATGETK